MLSLTSSTCFPIVPFHCAWYISAINKLANNQTSLPQPLLSSSWHLIFFFLTPDFFSAHHKFIIFHLLFRIHHWAFSPITPLKFPWPGHPELPAVNKDHGHIHLKSHIFFSVTDSVNWESFRATIKGLTEIKAGLDQAVILILDSESSYKFPGGWQISVPCSFRTEVPIFLVAASKTLFSTNKTTLRSISTMISLHRQFTAQLFACQSQQKKSCSLQVSLSNSLPGEVKPMQD